MFLKSISPRIFDNKNSKNLTGTVQVIWFLLDVEMKVRVTVDNCGKFSPLHDADLDYYYSKILTLLTLSAAPAGPTLPLWSPPGEILRIQISTQTTSQCTISSDNMNIDCYTFSFNKSLA